MTTTTSSINDDIIVYSQQHDEQHYHHSAANPIPIRRRKITEQSSLSLYDDDIEMSITTTTSRQENEQKTKQISSKQQQKMTVLAAVLMVGIIIYARTKHHSRRGWWYLVAFLLLPILTIANVAATSNNDSNKVSRSHNSTRQQAVASAVMASILGNQCPTFVSTFAAAVGLVLFGLAARSSKQNTTASSSSSSSYHHHLLNSSSGSSEMRGVVAALGFVMVMLTENFFVWVVSATYRSSHYNDPVPLQDNGRLIIELLFTKYLNLSDGDLQGVRDGINVQWALVAALASSFVLCQLNFAKERTLVGVAIRGLTTLATVRAIRTVSFLMTVLPSQVPNCYSRHFPQPPSNWKAWLLVGLIPNSRGGCNDLIISGHATVTSVMACICTSIANSLPFTISLWILLAFDYAIEVKQGLHYSVDMWLGAIVTSLIWKIYAPLEQYAPKEERHRHLIPLSTASPSDVMLYTLPAMLSFIAVTFLPNYIANLWLCCGFLWSFAILKYNGGNDFSFIQHVLLCTLYIGFGTYL